MQVEIETQKPKMQSNTVASPGKRKKDYVYKFWATLSQRCENIIQEYKTIQENPSVASNKPVESQGISNHDHAGDESKNDDEDVEMKEVSNEPDSNKLTFETLGEFMRNKQLIMLVAKFWTVLQAYIKQEAIEKESIKDARILLSSLMIAMFPKDVLDVPDLKDMDALSEACYAAAQQVLKHVFEKNHQFLSNVASGSGISDDDNPNQTKFHCEQAFKAVNKFFEAFMNWQSQDRSKILQSVMHFYEQWQRSYQVLKVSNMNEAQRSAVLETIEINANNMRNKILGLVNGDENEMKRLCAIVDNQIKAEQIAQSEKAEQSERIETAQKNSNESTLTKSDSENSGKPEQASVEEQLRARGVPVHMQTGNALKANKSKSYVEEPEKKENDSQYIEDVNGQKVLNLDTIVMEEASKNYWIEFEKQIENENWSRLFELLSEVLERIKKLSPEGDHKMLDEIIDVSFIQQTIQNGLIDATGFYGIFHGIWKQLRSLHAPVGDGPWDAWHDQVLKDMSKTDATWAKLLSSVFNKFLLKVDEIEGQVNAIKEIKAKNTK